MTYEALLTMFAGGALMALGFLGLVFGFFFGLLNPKKKLEHASLVFLFGVVALITGAWLMRMI